MKKIISITALAATIFCTPAVFAGDSSTCHFHGQAPATETVVVGCGKELINAYVADARIESSWKAAQLDKAETVEGRTAKEWKLTFKNPAALETGKKTLYMFFTLPGNFIGANFTGQ